MTSNITRDLVTHAYNEHSTQANAMRALREAGYRFSSSNFGRLWRDVAGKPKRERQIPVPIPALAPRGTSAEPAAIQLSLEPEELGPEEQPVFRGRKYSPDEYRKSLSGKRFVFTSAQNNTKVHAEFWQSLQHFCADKGALLGVARQSYNKSGWGAQGGVTKDGSTDTDDTWWYDSAILPYVIDEQVKVCDGLVFCGELDILPTAVMPLNGLDSYTGRNSAIVPHTKQHLKSLATMKHEDAKFLYSTGACTLRNYIERRAGQIASHHHVYGAMYVEVDEDGTWFARQINADDYGIFYDLERVYTPKGAFDASLVGRSVVTLGDIHIEKLDKAAWKSSKEMLQVLQPEAVILHDLIDFEARNHHNKRDPLFLANQYYNRDQTVESAFSLAARFIADLNTNFPGSKVYAIRSNHDIALQQWMREGSTFTDPPNAKFWHELNYVYLDGLSKDINLDMYAYALYKYKNLYDGGIQVKLVQEDESLVINGIEYGLHGHRGPNGARGNPASYRQIGARANTGHTHSAGIIDGVWTAGVLASLDMGYNYGPSSWSHSNIVTHPNGKRQIVTIKNGKWRA